VTHDFRPLNSDFRLTTAQPSLLLGVDGGNTKTVAVVATMDGDIVGTGRAGRSDIYNTPDEAAALDEIRSAVEDALQGAGATASDLVIGAFSMAGADWPEDIDLLRRGMTRFGFGQKVLVVNDAIGALRAGTPDGVGVGITCGTGIAIGARNRDDRIWYSGNWSVARGGAELGQLVLEAVYEARLELGPATSLTDGVLAFFEASSVEEVLHRTTARGTDRHWMEQARLAPILLDEAAHGDAAARAIVEAAGTRNANVAIVAARAVGLADGPVRLVLAGGVLRHPSRLLENAIRARVEAVLPAVEVISDAPEPVVGAVLLASDLLERPPDAKIVERLVASLPGSWLFAT
jgi:N-acetylglucosamine kinase-like BadF-type ATPase